AWSPRPPRSPTRSSVSSTSSTGRRSGSTSSSIPTPASSSSGSSTGTRRARSSRTGSTGRCSAPSPSSRAGRARSSRAAPTSTSRTSWPRCSSSWCSRDHRHRPRAGPGARRRGGGAPAGRRATHAEGASDGPARAEPVAALRGPAQAPPQGSGGLDDDVLGLPRHALRPRRHHAGRDRGRPRRRLADGAALRRHHPPHEPVPARHLLPRPRRARLRECLRRHGLEPRGGGGGARRADRGPRGPRDHHGQAAALPRARAARRLVRAGPSLRDRGVPRPVTAASNLLAFVGLVVTLAIVWRQSWPGRLRLFAAQSLALAALAGTLGLLAGRPRLLLVALVFL